MSRIRVKQILILICIFTLIMNGCSKKDYSAFTSEMLRCVSDEVLIRGGMEAEVRIMTIDLSEFQNFPIDDYVEWVINEYSSKDCIVIVSNDGTLPFEDNEEVLYALQELGYEEDVTWDWTNFRFTRVNDRDTLSKKEIITTHISYISINEAEGWETEVVFRDHQWTIKESYSTYIS